VLRLETISFKRLRIIYIYRLVNSPMVTVI
jgi:hypothetical protein